MRKLISNFELKKGKMCKKKKKNTCDFCWSDFSKVVFPSVFNIVKRAKNTQISDCKNVCVQGV